MPQATTAASATLPVVKLDVPDRRRAGRLENPSPELIALMRKPSAEAVRQVMLYDAPNFVLPTPEKGFSGRTALRVVGAATLCAAACGATFELMMLAWA